MSAWQYIARAVKSPLAKARMNPRTPRIGNLSAMMKVYWFLIRWYWATILVPILLLVAVEAVPGIPMIDRTIILWCFLLVVGVPASIISYLGSRQRAKEFTPAAGEPVAFSEIRVTGHSNASKIYSFLMLPHSLIVEVAADTIYIRPRSAGRGDMYREFHRIPVRDVTQAQKMGDRLRLTWDGETSGDFTLMLANPDAFLQSIHRTSLGTPLAY